jgi:hypothetical protein
MAKHEKLQKMTREIRLCAMPLQGTMNLKPMSGGRLRIAGIARIAIARFQRLKVVIPWCVVARIMEGISSLDVGTHSIGSLLSGTRPIYNAVNYQQ